MANSGRKKQLLSKQQPQQQQPQQQPQQQKHQHQKHQKHQHPKKQHQEAGTRKRRRSELRGRNSIHGAAMEHPTTGGRSSELEHKNNGNGSEKENNSYSDDDDDENTPMSAYQALLGSLGSKGGTFTRAFAQRQREEQGLSSNDDSLSGKDDDDVSEEDGSIGNDEVSIDADEIEDESDKEIGEDFDDHKGEIHSSKLEKAAAIVQDEEKQLTMGIENAQQEESEDEVVTTAQGSHMNAFKKHLEYALTDIEAAKLSKGVPKFRCQVVAAGIPKCKWVTTSTDFPVEERATHNCGVKLRLRSTWLSNHKDLLCGDFETDRQCQFFNYCNSYHDVQYSRRPTFYIDGDAQDGEIMDAYLLHVLNHISKTRDLVMKNNEKTSTALGIEEARRDQGFTRPKVLILLPLRSCAFRVVKRLLNLVPPLQKSTVEHKSRFYDEFGVEEDSDSDDHATEKKPSKPADYKALFDGNNDDHFRIGIKLTRKSVKLYSDFYSSDLIIASPLGLITRIGEAEQEKDKDVDFLSSIEILIVDYAECILMQNWSHVVEIGEQLNKIPVQQHGTDFMRIREWVLNGNARYYRQSIILSAFADAGINAFFHRSCFNYAGKIKLRCEHPGVLSKVLLQVRQVYERFNSDSLAEADDARFNLFVKQVFISLKESLQGGIMIFVSSYFDFVRLRNFLKSENMSFCLLGEYTKASDISRSRAWFFHGKRRVMLYSERAHFYHRYKIRGIKNLIFYSLPENAEFYAEIMNMMEGLDNPSSLALFSQFDNLKLERIVGTSRASKMLKSENRTFMFC